MSEQVPGRDPEPDGPPASEGGMKPPATQGPTSEGSPESSPATPAPQTETAPARPAAEPPVADRVPPQATERVTPDEKQPDLPLPLQAGEQVLQLCRRHWIYLWPSVALQLVLAVAPLIIAVFLLDLLGVDGTVETVLWIILGVHVAYRLLKSFLTWYRYHNDIWVITNQRLIDSYKKHPFSLAVASADLVNVQDISIQRDGILRTMLDYGDIVCQTAGVVLGFRLTGVPDPRTTQALIDRERDRERLRTR